MIRGSSVLVLTITALLGAGVAAQHANDWPTVGNDPGGMKYSPLTQITPANVTRLTKAWTYDMGVPATGYTVTPIVVNNVMYFPVQGSTIGFLVQLNAKTGATMPGAAGVVNLSTGVMEKFGGSYSTNTAPALYRNL